LVFIGQASRRSRAGLAIHEEAFMTNRPDVWRRVCKLTSGIFDRTRLGVPLAAACAFALVVGWGEAALAAGPAAGDAYVYRLVNGYNKEIRGQLHYQVSKVEGGNATVLVTPDTAEGGVQRTDLYTGEGNWLRHPLDSHGQLVQYEFATAYPAYVFPLEPGKTWSVRVKASVAGTARPRSVRVDGKVLGNERISVPAGEFDTVKIRRIVYPGDTDYFLTETQITELDWYAPALGRAVRTERRSQWLDLASCFEQGSCVDYGDWHIFELAPAGVAK
jgi:hypothetical protein